MGSSLGRSSNLLFSSILTPPHAVRTPDGVPTRICRSAIKYQITFNKGVKNRRLPDFVETIRISQQGYAVLT